MRLPAWTERRERNAEPWRDSISLSELANLDLGPGFIPRQAAGEVVGEIAALDAKHNRCELKNLALGQRAIAAPSGNRQPLVRLQLEVLRKVEHGVGERELDLVAIFLPRVHH